MSASESWYDPSNARALTAMVVVACISFICVSSLLATLTWSLVSGRGPTQKPFLKSHIGAYFVSLLVADMLHEIACMACTRWLVVGHVYSGPLCTMQGFLNHFALVSIAFWNAVVAIYSLSVLLFNARISNMTCIVTVVGTWSAIALVLLIGPTAIQSHERGPFYGIAGNWCWINPAYPAARFWLHYFFMFASAALSIVVYTMIFFRLRGNLVAAGYKLYIVRTSPSQAWNLQTGRAALESDTMKLAWQLMWYPVAYTVYITPLAITRVPAMSGVKIPSIVVTLGGLTMMLGGFLDTLLFIITRHKVLPVKLRRTAAPESSTVLSGPTTHRISFAISPCPAKHPETTMFSLGNSTQMLSSAGPTARSIPGENAVVIYPKLEQRKDQENLV